MYRKLAKAICLLRTPLYRSALVKGVAATIEHDHVLRFLEGQGVNFVVDIGANAGQFSLAARNCIPNAEIVAFEPLARPAERYCAVFADDHKVMLFQNAIGSTTGEVEMHVSKADDSSSLLPITSKQSELFPGTEESHMERVKVVSLSTFLDKKRLNENALLKIDVQGYELETLKGCESLLKGFTYLYIECSFVELYQDQALAHEVIAWLYARGFSLSRIGIMTFGKDKMSIQGDLLFHSQYA